MKPYAILSMPSQGSTWFKDCVMLSQGLSYGGEFFHPLLNIQHYDTLTGAFGSGLYDLLPVVLRGYENHDWLREPYDRCLGLFRTTGLELTKETWSAWKHAFFNEHFEVMYLVRSFRRTFPPHRLRFVEWYANIHHAICHDWEGKPSQFRCDHAFCYRNSRSQVTVQQRVALAFAAGTKQLDLGARAVERKVISYDCLMSMSLEELPLYLLARVPCQFDVPRLAKAIYQTRRDHPRDPQWLPHWESAYEYYDQVSWLDEHGLRV